ncbi:MAG TPA: DinB family protein, partial [Burkholderiaceae bacterium]
MHSRFDQFRKTRLGIQLETVLADPLRYVEFAALARAKVPSIVAISHELGEKFPELTDDTTARQFCGAMVAEVMRSRGHEVVQARGRAGG